METTRPAATDHHRAPSGAPTAGHGGRGRRWLAMAAGALAAGGALAACSSGSAKPVAATAAKPPAVTVHEAMVILTGGMVKQSGWPLFVPSDVTVPTGATVDVTIYNYDDGTAALPPSVAMYGKASGVTGLTEAGQPVTSVSAADVSHTWTIPTLGLNVPIEAAPAANGGPHKPMVVTFSFKAVKAGTYTWKCFAPCGDGTDGMGGAMATNGYMQGSFTVA